MTALRIMATAGSVKLTRHGSSTAARRITREEQAWLRQLALLKVGEALADHLVPGLRVRRRQGGLFMEYRYPAPSGSRSARPGQWRAVSVGRVHEWWLTANGGEPSVNLLRDKARALADQVAGGHDPHDPPYGYAAFTLQEALELHLEGKVRSPETVKDYKSAVDLHLADWKARPLISLSREDVRKRHQKIGKTRGAYAANGAMRVLRAVWNRARRQYPELPECPTANVDWNKETRRDAAIPLAALPKWYAEVVAHPNTIRRDYYLLAAFTGLRRRTVDCIRRGDIDLETKMLHIPKPKGGESKAFTLPLSDFLVELIRRRLENNAVWWERVNKTRKMKGKAARVPNDYLFPAHSKSGHLSEPKPSTESANARHTFTIRFTVHGLRNTYLSAAAAASVSPYHAKLLANHALPRADVTAGYISADVDALRPSQQRVTDYLLAAMKPRFTLPAPSASRSKEEAE